mgnify:CR=1 FL=1
MNANNLPNRHIAADQWLARREQRNRLRRAHPNPGHNSTTSKTGGFHISYRTYIVHQYSTPLPPYIPYYITLHIV